ncbi:WD repeat-containing protein 72-like [Rhineura floridana]|uniref:WD repeat-containing protein 72-like n=1 Tax=Rhineura floridana TaxID=261503 RepID=UPI002AC85669|nr:WD repeat-containing protein 72-like [Rhineura floridana]
MIEAIQAALLAEVQQSMGKTLANEPERRKGRPSLAASKCDSCTLTPANVQEEKGIAERRVLEESENADEKKSHPWMLKVCSCKVC